MNLTKQIAIIDVGFVLNIHSMIPFRPSVILPKFSCQARKYKTILIFLSRLWMIETHVFMSTLKSSIIVQGVQLTLKLQPMDPATNWHIFCVWSTLEPLVDLLRLKTQTSYKEGCFYHQGSNVVNHSLYIRPLNWSTYPFSKLSIMKTKKSVLV